MNNVLRITVVCLCLGGVGVSALSLRSHYSESRTGYCALDDTFNCDIVNRSIYSQFLGVPVAAIGLLGYVAILLMALRNTSGSTLLGAASAWLGLAFSLYLTYVEAYVLAVWCLLCIGSQVAIAGVAAVLTVVLWKQRGTNNPLPENQ